MKYVTETRNGWELACEGTYWSISFPNANGIGCSGVHTGTESYIRKLWNTKCRPWAKNYSGQSVKSLLTRE